MIVAARFVVVIVINQWCDGSCGDCSGVMIVVVNAVV